MWTFGEEINVTSVVEVLLVWRQQLLHGLKPLDTVLRVATTDRILQWTECLSSSGRCVVQALQTCGVGSLAVQEYLKDSSSWQTFKPCFDAVCHVIIYQMTCANCHKHKKNSECLSARKEEFSIIIGYILQVNWICHDSLHPRSGPPCFLTHDKTAWRLAASTTYTLYGHSWTHDQQFRLSEVRAKNG